MRQKRMYSLFQKVAGRWLRIDAGAYPKEKAIHVYQDRLLNGLGLGLELRPVKPGQGLGVSLWIAR